MSTRVRDGVSDHVAAKWEGNIYVKTFIIMNLHRSVLMEIRLVYLIDELSGLNN